jgi:hypothetical protein
MFDDYTTWLQSEIASLEEDKDIGEEGAKALCAVANVLTDQLAAEWNESVERLHKDVPFLIERRMKILKGTRWTQ